MDIARMIKEQRDSGVITLPIGKSGQSATKVPVRFLVGGPGWAMHIRLPVSQTPDHNLVIQRLPFNPAFRGLYEAIGVTVGSGITADFHEWFYYVHLIWPESKNCGLIEKPIEFQKLLLVAGVNSTRSSLQDVVWWTLGGILAKSSAVSRGDDSWSKRYKEMEVPFQRYLVGDTGPPSLAAWVLIMCWAVHVFPDPSGVYSNVKEAHAEGDPVDWPIGVHENPLRTGPQLPGIPGGEITPPSQDIWKQEGSSEHHQNPNNCLDATHPSLP
jgi:hypothetical protein